MILAVLITAVSMSCGLSVGVAQAVKAGGPDPEVNRSLFVLIREAKASGVPNDNIQRAITRGSSASEADYKEAVYEVRTGEAARRHGAVGSSRERTRWGDRLIHVCCRAQAYGYGGAGVIINCLTDNTNRAKTEINNAIKKSDVSAGQAGSAAIP